MHPIIPTMQHLRLYIAALLLQILLPLSAANYNGIYMTASGVFNASDKNVVITITHIDVLDQNRQLIHGVLDITAIDVYRSVDHGTATRVGTTSSVRITDGTPDAPVIWTDSELPDPGTGSVLVTYQLRARIGSYTSEPNSVSNAGGQGDGFAIDYRDFPNPVSNLTATVYTPDSVVLHMQAPSSCTNGNPLTTISNIRIDKYNYSTYSWQSQYTFRSTAAKPGAELKWVDTNISSDTYLQYRVVVVVGSNENTRTSEYAEIQAFNGIDTPTGVLNLAAKSDDNSILLSWQAPTTGLNGGTLAPDQITYRIERVVEGGKVELLSAAQHAVTTYRDVNLRPHCATYLYVVTPSTSNGTGSANSVSIYAGAPYSLPFAENTKSGFDNTGWLAIDSYGRNAGWATANNMADTEHERYIFAADNSALITTTLYVSNTVAGRRDYLQSAPILCTDINTLHVQFDYYAMTGYDNRLSVEVSIDGEHFTEMGAIDFTTLTETGWQTAEMSADLSSSQLCYVRFVSLKGSHSNSLAIDNILITGELDPAKRPIITLHTHRYETYGADNQVQFSLLASIKAGKTTIDVDFGYGRESYVITSDGIIIEDDEQEVITGGVTISGTVSPEGVIRIYGNAQDIDYFDCHGSEVYDIELSAMTELSILELGHNNIQRLDLTSMPNLEYLDLKDNSFEQGLYLGEYPYLKYLNVNMLGDYALDHCAGTIDLSKYLALRVFTAWDSHCLKTLDPSPCQYLQQLSVDNTGLHTLDVTHNPYLQILNISDSPIGEIDLSQNSYLVELYCANEGQAADNAKLSTLDVSHNTHLQRIFCSGNNLTTIDVRGLYNLITLDAANNRMTSIRGVDFILEDPEDLPVELASLDLSGNYFSYATLPMVDELTYFYYDLQHELPVKKEYGVCENGYLDLSEYITRDGTENAIVMACIARDGFSYDYQLFEDKDFTFDPETGIIRFLTPQTDSVQVAIINSYFYGTTLLTTKFLVRSAEDYGQPVPLMSFAPANDAAIEFTVATNVSEPLYVDFGNGERIQYDMTAHNPMIINGQSAGQVTLYGSVAMKLEQLQMDHQPLLTIDLKLQDGLRTLSLTNCELRALDLSWNNQLRQLDLSGNAISELDLTGDNDAFNKNMLTDVNISNNNMKVFVPGKSSATFLHLNAANNELTELDLTDMYSLKTLDLSTNYFTELDLSGCANLSELNIANNSISQLDLSANTLLQSADVHNNHLTFSTLYAAGQPRNCLMTYAPQLPIQISPMATGIWIRNEWNIDGHMTQFLWREIGTELALTEGIDYILLDGKTTFLEPIYGKNIYCEMQNDLFPDFRGFEVLRTTVTTPVDAPKYTIAEFTTPVEGQTAYLSLAGTQPDTYIYIDWGDGGLQEYHLQEVYTLFEYESTIANARVHVYSNVAENGHMRVFSISGVAMTDLDVSRMTDLYCLTINNAGLKTIDLSQLSRLGELNLNGNQLTDIDLTANTQLGMLVLSNNRLTHFTIPEHNQIGWFAAAGNLLTTIDNQPLGSAYNIDVAHNQIQHIDMDRLPGVSQLFVADNQLHELDIDRTMMVLDISSNYFDMATLPDPELVYNFYYGNQAPIRIACIDGAIDLSRQQQAWDVTSNIYFFEGEIYLYEDENGDIQLANGEYYEGEDFFNDNGIIRFAEDQPAVTGLIVNELYPNLLLYTTTIAVTGMHQDVPSTHTNVQDGKSYNVMGQPVPASFPGIVIRDQQKRLNLR